VRDEVCRVAKELADERGGKPSHYMQEAWDIVKDRHDYSRPRRMSGTQRRGMDAFRERGAESMSAWGWAAKTVGKFMVRQTVEKSKAAGRSMDFTKAPKDSPKDVFGGATKMFTKRPEKVEVPDSVKKYLKDTFRLK
jgi:hypothetical protein